VKRIQKALCGLALITGCASGDGSGPSSDACRISWQADDTAVEVSMSEDERSVTLTKPSQVLHYEFDAAGRWIRSEITQSPARAPTDFTYDAQGHLTSRVTFAEPGTTCTNQYDTADRLIARDCDGTQYAYTFDTNDRITQVTITNPGNPSVITDITYDAMDRITREESANSRYSYTYDADDRMTTMERDWVFGGGKDGTSDIRWTWNYRSSGGVSTYEQDGTDHADNPFIDGTPDLIWTFTEACDAIGAVHPWIYNYPTIIDVGHPLPPFPF